MSDTNNSTNIPTKIAGNNDGENRAHWQRVFYGKYYERDDGFTVITTWRNFRTDAKHPTPEELDYNKADNEQWMALKYPGSIGHEQIEAQYIGYLTVAEFQKIPAPDTSALLERYSDKIADRRRREENASANRERRTFAALRSDVLTLAVIGLILAAIVFAAAPSMMKMHEVMNAPAKAARTQSARTRLNDLIGQFTASGGTFTVKAGAKTIPGDDKTAAVIAIDTANEQTIRDSVIAALRAGVTNHGNLIKLDEKKVTADDIAALAATMNGVKPVFTPAPDTSGEY